MMRGFGVTLGAVVLAASCAGGSAPPSDEPAAPFAVASVHFEQNATDGDVEVVFEVKGGDDWLASLTVTAPDGRTVVSASSPDSSTMGSAVPLRVAEPTDAARLKAAYPEGSTPRRRRDRRALRGTATEPSTACRGRRAHARRRSEVWPCAACVTWTPVPDAAAYVVTIEEADLTLSVTLPGSATAFAVPDGVLQPGREYTLAVGAVLPGGNASFVETSFATAGKE
jgi:hypothetical protein